MKWICIIVFFAISIPIIAQNDTLKIEFDKKTQATFYVDKLHHIYTVSNGFELKKFNEKMELLYTYSNFKNGKIKTIDVSNPFQIMLFSSETNRVIYLDNKLYTKATYQLFDWHLNNISSACRANDNHLWLFDNDDFRLILINEEGKIQLKSEELFTFLNNSPSQMFFLNNILYLYDETRGLLMFDNNGIYIKTIPLFYCDIQQIIGNIIISIKNNTESHYNTETMETKQDSTFYNKIWYADGYKIVADSKFIYKIK